MILDCTTEKLIELALEEDIGSGDITTEATIDNNSTSEAVILANQELVISGIDVAIRVFEKIDHEIVFSILKSDGSKVTKGVMIAKLTGKSASILKGERVALNFIQHLSGIATFTSKYVAKIKNDKTKILDTRKTTPGMRLLEKQAVKSGGGENHRMGLYDMVLIKDNHIAACGSISKAVELARGKAPKNFKVEVEVEDLIQVDEALKSGADIIMLDNMDIITMGKAISHIAGRAKAEVSGNVSIDNIEQIAKLEPDYISIGRITHSAPAADISLNFIPD